MESMIRIERKRLKSIFQFSRVTGRFWEFAHMGVRHILTLLESVLDLPAIVVQTGVWNRSDLALGLKGCTIGCTDQVFRCSRPRCDPIRRGRNFSWSGFLSPL